MSYYSDTAYDSTQPRTQAPTPDLKVTLQFRRTPMALSPGVHCGEHLADSDLWEALRCLGDDTDPECQQYKSGNWHETQQWESLQNPRTRLSVFTSVMGFFSILWGGGVLFIMLISKNYRELFGGAQILFIYTPTTLYFLGKLALKHNWVKDKGNIIFNRRTGMITTVGTGEPKDIPFDEFDPFLYSQAHAVGAAGYRLHLGHRYSVEDAHAPADHNTPIIPYRKWEFLQAFMDISRPLPDTPELEPFRHKDPVTANYDQRHKRPPHYWRNMDPEKAKRLYDEAVNASYNFPWGQTREQALANGWKPSPWSPRDYQVEGEIGTKALIKPKPKPTKEELLAQKMGN